MRQVEVLGFSLLLFWLYIVIFYVMCDVFMNEWTYFVNPLIGKPKQMCKRKSNCGETGSHNK